MIKPEQFQEVVDIIDTMNAWKKDLASPSVAFWDKKKALVEIKTNLARLVEFYGELDI